MMRFLRFLVSLTRNTHSEVFRQLLIALLPTLGVAFVGCLSLHQPSCAFHHGQALPHPFDARGWSTWIAMVKQKASDRRRGRRREQITSSESAAAAAELPATITTSPMKSRPWVHKMTAAATTTTTIPSTSTDGTLSIQQPSSGGRQRSRKRTALYNSLSLYHNVFLRQLTTEYQAEEAEVLSRIKASMDDPLRLEGAGHVVFDMALERRGNLFLDQVYRLTKAKDATTTYPRTDPRPFTATTTVNREPSGDDKSSLAGHLPKHHKFATNDVILLTLQPNGSGDFFSSHSLPTSEGAVSLEARVLNTGPTYIDIAVSAGLLEATFGLFDNDISAELRHSRFRVDRFFSNIPYQRMVDALATLTSIPDRSGVQPVPTKQDQADAASSKVGFDEVFREVILTTFVESSAQRQSVSELESSALNELSNKLSKPPLAGSPKLASQVMVNIKANSLQIFPPFNRPQLSAIEAALSRRLTLIQGPPGTGKTACASAIGYGFVHQCRSLSRHAKVLACAFSNVGADNLAEAMIKLGLSIVRVGRPSAVAKTLWDCTLEAAIDRDLAAQAALKEATRATLALARLNRSSGSSKSSSTERAIRDAATRAVKAAIEASNVAATKCLREADVVVSTCTGASDPRLLAACGLTAVDVSSDDSTTRVASKEKRSMAGQQANSLKKNAPDGLPPLSLPFVIVDEACQSVEPATLIPIVASNSCRSLVMLGDPCQLPPTVLSGDASQLSISLFERLAATLPPPAVHVQVDSTSHDVSYLDSRPIKKALVVLQSLEPGEYSRSNRKQFGVLLLSIQYRMHPSIAAFSSAVFYDGLLSTPNFLAGQRPFPAVLRAMMPCSDQMAAVRFVDVGGRCNERRGAPGRYSPAKLKDSITDLLEEGATYSNMAEAERVLGLLNVVANAREPGIGNIGIVSPYSGQVELIKTLMAGDIPLQKQLVRSNVEVEVKSVDGYQGRERDLIVFSCVRSNRRGKIGFLHDWRRMNVALTRSRCGLVVLGDLETLSETDGHWAALVTWASEGRYVFKDWATPSDEPQE